MLSSQRRKVSVKTTSGHPWQLPGGRAGARALHPRQHAHRGGAGGVRPQLRDNGLRREREEVAGGVRGAPAPRVQAEHRGVLHEGRRGPHLQHRAARQGPRCVNLRE